MCNQEAVYEQDTVIVVVLFACHHGSLPVGGYTTTDVPALMLYDEQTDADAYQISTCAP